MKDLWQHQIDAIRKAQGVNNLFLGMEQGTGKTRATIEILRRRYAENGKILKTLILSPVIVCDNWKKEWAMYSKINQNDIVVLTQAGRKRCIEFTKAVGDNLERPKVVITNYQGLLINDLFELIHSWKPDILVCDESQRVKNHQSKTAKRVLLLSDRAKHKYMLTGTPILNSAMDLWMQFRIMDGGETFGRNFFAFRASFFIDKNSSWSGNQGYFPKWEPTTETFQRMQDLIKDKMIRVTKEECMDLPPLVRQEIDVELSPQQKRMYKEMRDEFIAFVNDNVDRPRTVTAQLAITKALRLQQIVTGYAATEQAGVEELEEVPRMKVLKELLEDLTPNHKVIVWCVFKQNYAMIADMLTKQGIQFGEITGDISHAKRITEMDRFRNDPKCRVMIANQAAGGSGINLVEASYAIYYSKNFSLENDLQSEARNHRGGSEIHQKVTRIDLVARETIDELVNEALAKKQEISQVILNWKDKV